MVGTLLFILFTGYFLNYFLADRDQKLPGFEPEKPPPYSEQWHPSDPEPKTAEKEKSKRSNSLANRKRFLREMEPMIHELRAETYFGLIRLLKPGCRSIIIIVDKDSKDVLLPKFARYVFPYRKYVFISILYILMFIYKPRCI